MGREPYPETPESDKLLKVAQDSQKIGEFLDWLLREHQICDYIEEDEEFYPVFKSIEKWLAEYYEIDLDKVDQEKRELLEWIRKQ